jgi:hypothetical protein
MLPLFAPAAELFHPVVVGLAWLAAGAVAGTVAVAVLVAVGARRRAVSRARRTPRRPRLPEACYGRPWLVDAPDTGR